VILTKDEVFSPSTKKKGGKRSGGRGRKKRKTALIWRKKRAGIKRKDLNSCHPIAKEGKREGVKDQGKGGDHSDFSYREGGGKSRMKKEKRRCSLPFI